ncbi:MAG: hypothetical protein AAF152_08715 [Cyanobacteria bacterium P01_A01_bin.114]
MGTIAGLQIPKLAALQDTAQLSAARKQSSQKTALNLELAKYAPAFGFNNVLSNWIFLQFLQYFGGDELRQQFGYQLSANFFEAILEKDPYYRDFYLFLSGSATLYAGQPEEAVALMANGLENLGPQQPPDSFYIWRYKGTDELLFLGDVQAAQQSYAMAAEWASQSSYVDGVLISEISQNMAQVLSQNPDSTAVKISAWSGVLSNALDDTARARATQEIRNLGGDVIQTPEGPYKIVFPNEDE